MKQHVRASFQQIHSRELKNLSGLKSFNFKTVSPCFFYLLWFMQRAFEICFAAVIMVFGGVSLLNNQTLYRVLVKPRFELARMICLVLAIFPSFSVQTIGVQSFTETADCLDDFETNIQIQKTNDGVALVGFVDKGKEANILTTLREGVKKQTVGNISCSLYSFGLTGLRFPLCTLCHWPNTGIWLACPLMGSGWPATDVWFSL